MLAIWHRVVDEIQEGLSTTQGELADLADENKKQMGIIEHLTPLVQGKGVIDIKHPKSTKQPDPEIFSGTGDVKYSLWKLQMNGKFLVNGDHFDSEVHKLVYFFGRTSGDAQTHLQPRYEDDSVNKFTIVDQMFEHLDNIYLNPFEKEDARDAYYKLKMKNGQAYTEFHTTFLHLAGKARIPDSELKADLTKKLSTDLNKAIRPRLTTFDTLDALHKELIFQDNQLRADRIAADRRARFQARTSTTSVTPVPSSKDVLPTKKPFSKDGLITAIRPINTDKTTTNPITGKTRPTYSDPVMDQRSRDGLCLKCGKPGHRHKNCPNEAVGINNMEWSSDDESDSDSEN
jgi:hypothetical protein